MSNYNFNNNDMRKIIITTKKRNASKTTISQFPKQRNELPEAYKKIYNTHYEENRKGKTRVSSLSSKLENWLHKKVANTTAKNAVTLEIGAGTLNQLKYEKSKIYDIVEPFELLYKNSPDLHKIRHIYSDISEITREMQYDRIIAIASFEHILNLPDVVEKAYDLLKTGGKLCVSIPNEGRFLWRLAYTLTTGLEFRRRFGLDYGVLMRYEHCNTADEIESILISYFCNTKYSLFGIGKTFSLYRYYECTKE